MIIINNIKLDITDDKNEAIKKAIKMLGLPLNQIKTASIRKVSTDARKKTEIKFVYSVVVEVIDEKIEANFTNKSGDIQVKKKTQIQFLIGKEELENPPIIAGFGPAGLFAALVLARQGFNPIVLEQGDDIDTRKQKVQNFIKTKTLDVNSNIQFGEGGAGTFSDGKLTTRIGDERCEFILKTFADFGAPEEVLYKAKPHIGTDLLTGIIKNIRNEIIKHGGKVLFNTKLLDIKIVNDELKSVITNKGEMKTENLILATGHSARDMFFMLKDKEIKMSVKPFSVGVRIEHLQSEIDKSLYHTLAGHENLEVGEYQLANTKGDRGVYTFCMCPGGNVVAAASEEETVVVNGMSMHKRNGKNANSAVVVSVNEKDFDNDFTKAIAFQRELEKAAFIAGGKNYCAPAQTVDNFLNSKKGLNINTVNPTYPIGVKDADFNKILPEFALKNIKESLLVFDRKLKGFAKGDSVLTGVETRTSSPVRIHRNDEFQSNVKGIYPCGEGAGFAGGIMSSAVDGVRLAQFISSKYKPKY